MSEQLIADLAIDLRAVSRFAVMRRLALGIGAGAAVSAILTAATLGFRPDMAEATREGMFWVKLAYTLTLGGVALWACERLTRPAGLAASRIAWLVAPALALTALAGWQLMQTPVLMRMPIVMGHTASICPWCIPLVSLGPLVGLSWAVRGLAPTRLRLTGLMVGLAAGGVGAAIYALHCDEMAAPFLAIWYTLGVCGCALIGLLAGPRILRW